MIMIQEIIKSFSYYKRSAERTGNKRSHSTTDRLLITDYKTGPVSALD